MKLDLQAALRKLPLLRRGEYRRLKNLNDWGGLLNSEQNVEVCDATDDAHRYISW